MSDKNCWEFKKCGRQPGGDKVKEFGVCPAAKFMSANGFCGGFNGGRACLYITGTFCGGRIQGTHKDKSKQCEECEFYKKLREEDGAENTIWMFNKYIKEKEEENKNK